MKNDLEKRLSQLKLSPPSAEYLRRGRKLARNSLNDNRTLWPYRLNWLLAGFLVLSMGINLALLLPYQAQPRELVRSCDVGSGVNRFVPETAVTGNNRQFQTPTAAPDGFSNNTLPFSARQC